MVKISAIVSVYNARDFLPGRLDNLLAQEDVDLEIICVNAGSRHPEDAQVLSEYASRDNRIRVIETPRDPLYHSWNIGIAVAQGDYITNANCDDRLAPHALRKLVEALDNGADVAYGSCYCTVTKNAVWDGAWDFFLDDPVNYAEGLVRWGHVPFDAQRLLQFCYLGPFPAWRKSLHQRVGEFDSSYAIAGDYEMWLRFAAAGAAFQNIPLYLGLFYFDKSQLSQSSGEHLNYESRRARLKWRSQIEGRDGL